MSKPCPAYSNPSRTRRTVISAAPECAPGAGRTKGLVQIPLYENFNPLQPEFETINLNRAKPGLGPEGFAAGLGFYRLQATIYAYGSGYANMPPPWTTLLEAAGWEGTRSFLSTTTPPLATGVILTTSNTADGDLALGYYYYKFAKVVNGIEEEWSAEGGAASNVEANVTGVNDTVTIDFNTGTTDFNVNDVVQIYRTRVNATAVGGAGLVYYNVGTFTITSTDDNSAAFIADPTITQTGEVWVDTRGDLELGDEAPVSGADNVAADYPAAFVTDSAHVIWKPVSEFHKSLTLWTWLDHARYPASGVRGNISFQGNTGALFEGSIDYQGVYNPRIVEANPTTGSVNPGIPPRVCGIDFTIDPEGGTPFSPIVKSLGINFGTNPTQRLDGNADECLLEVGIFNEFDTRWTAQIEVDNVRDFIEWFKEGKRFKLDATIAPVTSPTGKRIRFYNPIYGALLIQAPTFDDSNGVRVINIEWQMGDPTGGNRFLYVLHY